MKRYKNIAQPFLHYLFLAVAISFMLASAPVIAVAFKSTHEIVFEDPDCDPEVEQVQIIRESEDWKTINDTRKQVFCVYPGDYSDVGRIYLTTSGSSEEPRYLKLRDEYERVGASSSQYDMHPVNKKYSERAIISGLTLVADYWIIDRIVIAGAGTVASGEVDVTGDNNIFNALLFENSWRWALYLFRGSEFNVIQNSVARNPSRFRDEYPNYDAAAFGVSDAEAVGIPDRFKPESAGDYRSRGNKFISNEIVNFVDGIQLIVSSRSAGVGYQDFSGTIIDDNDIYAEPLIYRTSSGALSTGGEYACTENGVDIKSGGSGFMLADRLTISNNRIWGIRSPKLPLAKNCKKNHSSGVAIASSGSMDGVKNDFYLIEGNILFDIPRGIQIGRKNSTGHIVQNNIVAEMAPGPNEDNEIGLALSWKTNASSGLGVYVRSNIIKGFPAWTSNGSKAKGGVRYYGCNYIIDSKKAAAIAEEKSTYADRNIYLVQNINRSQISQPGTNDLVLEVGGDYFGDGCFETRQITGAQIRCLKGVVPNSHIVSSAGCPDLNIPLLTTHGE